ncbi:hypothetical protein VP01_2792g1, partial [Puccinia sorghi]
SVGKGRSGGRQQWLIGECTKVWRLKIIPQLGKPLASPRGRGSSASVGSLRKEAEAKYRMTKMWVHKLAEMNKENNIHNLLSILVKVLSLIFLSSYQLIISQPLFDYLRNSLTSHPIFPHIISSPQNLDLQWTSNNLAEAPLVKRWDSLIIERDSEQFGRGGLIYQIYQTHLPTQEEVCNHEVSNQPVPAPSSDFSDSLMNLLSRFSKLKEKSGRARKGTQKRSRQSNDVPLRGHARHNRFAVVLSLMTQIELAEETAPRPWSGWANPIKTIGLMDFVLGYGGPTDRPPSYQQCQGMKPCLQPTVSPAGGHCGPNPQQLSDEYRSVFLTQWCTTCADRLQKSHFLCLHTYFSLFSLMTQIDLFLTNQKITFFFLFSIAKLLRIKKVRIVLHFQYCILFSLLNKKFIDQQYFYSQRQQGAKSLQLFFDSPFYWSQVLNSKNLLCRGIKAGKSGGPSFSGEYQSIQSDVIVSNSQSSTENQNSCIWKED